MLFENPYSKSNFKNPYHKPILFWDERHRDLDLRVKFVDEEFQYEEVEDSSQCFMDWNSPPTYDTYVDVEDLIKVEEKFNFKEEEIVDHFWEIYMKINEYRVKQESQYDKKSFQAIIRSHVVMGCKLFLFRH